MSISKKIIDGNDQPSEGNAVVGGGGSRALNPSEFIDPNHALGVDASGQSISDINNSLQNRFFRTIRLLSGAAAAYSLRNVSSGSTESTDVVRLRRASDSAESDFTAAELTGSVEGAEMVTNGDFATDTDWTKGLNWTISGGQAISDGTVLYGGLRQDFTENLIAGEYYILSFDVVACSNFNGLGLAIETNSVTTSIRSVGTGMGITTAGSHSVIFLAGATGLNFAWYTESGTTATIDNVSFKPYTPTAAELWSVDGIPVQSRYAKATSQSAYATTWYDQSGSGNDATQATAASQPKLITAGVTETDNGKPALLFDGTDDYLDIASNPLTVLDNLMVSVVAKPLGVTAEYGVTLSEPVRRIYVPYLGTGNMYLGYDTSATAISDGAITNDQQLLTLSVDATTASGFKNGAAFSVTPTSTADSGAVVETGNVPQIGAYSGGGNWDGTFQEVIVYPIDQSANRTAIERNINTHYGIY